MSLHIITGCMFSGKSTALLNAYEECDDHAMLINHESDIRYSTNGDVTTHDRRARSSKRFRTLCAAMCDPTYAPAKAVFIDEAQFFPDLYTMVWHMVEVDRKRVTVAGLHSNFKAQKFGQVLDLVPISSNVTFLYAKCAECGEPASFSELRDDHGHHSTIGIGHNDVYVVKCREHSSRRR